MLLHFLSTLYWWQAHFLSHPFFSLARDPRFHLFGILDDVSSPPKRKSSGMTEMPNGSGMGPTCILATKPVACPISGLAGAQRKKPRDKKFKKMLHVFKNNKSELHLDHKASSPPPFNFFYYTFSSCNYSL